MAKTITFYLHVGKCNENSLFDSMQLHSLISDFDVNVHPRLFFFFIERQMSVPCGIRKPTPRTLL